MFLVVLVFLFIFRISAQEQYRVTERVYFDIKVDEKHLGRIVLGLFGEIAPKTTKNFYTIATTGMKGKTYAGTKFHRIIKRFMIQGGDIVNNNGSGSMSIYGKYFEDENFDVKHEGPGFLSMANSGPDTNGCQFFIITTPTHWLNGKHTVFGKVLDGQGIVHKIEQLKTDVDDRPKHAVVISECGAIPTPSSFYVSAISYNFTELIRAGALPIGMSFIILAFFQYAIHVLRRFEKIKIRTD